MNISIKINKLVDIFRIFTYYLFFIILLINNLRIIYEVLFHRGENVIGTYNFAYLAVGFNRISGCNTKDYCKSIDMVDIMLKY
ncbi:hypothetical protein EDL79_01335 [Ehrlichia ruminantium]|uniref:Uncharacterized protein n=1 Tax=Ehrlichia ruminantium TaxID=779 RepID=A0AAE6QAI6_EHRRU|nr:hypothetical protein EDL80_01335 [Ehrlichia ruminantium]QGR04168.1 hypothetical protein EDL79_01335 [Ehrlichia ruminantium]